MVIYPPNFIWKVMIMSWQPNRQSDSTLQQQIVQWVTAQVERGDWAAGTKLPPQRQLTMQSQYSSTGFRGIKGDGHP